jgi:hypothetical protein
MPLRQLCLGSPPLLRITTQVSQVINVASDLARLPFRGKTAQQTAQTRRQRNENAAKPLA